MEHAEPDAQQHRRKREAAATTVDRLALDMALSPGPLNARQVLQLQRLVGNRAVQRILAQQSPSARTLTPKRFIQRNVGFEFEVGGYNVSRMTQNMTPGQFAGTTHIQPNELDDTPLAKADVLANRTGVEMQIDEGANDFHLEFVTTGVGFPETKAGRADLKVAMEGMEEASREVTAKNATPGPTLNHGGARHA